MSSTLSAKTNAFLIHHQITLMDWGNAFVRSKATDASGQVTSVELELHLEGDFKKTKKKITWLAQPTSEHPLIPVTLLDYDYLITKKKLEENDSVKDFITPVTEFRESALADANVKDLKKGDIIQFERKGYFIYDGENKDDGRMEFIRIPDGKAAGIASKAGASTEPAASQSVPKNPSSAEAVAANASSMYKVDNVYGGDVQPGVPTSMYKVDTIYD